MQVVSETVASAPQIVSTWDLQDKGSCKERSIIFLTSNHQFKVHKLKWCVNCEHLTPAFHKCSGCLKTHSEFLSPPEWHGKSPPWSMSSDHSDVESSQSASSAFIPFIRATNIFCFGWTSSLCDFFQLILLQQFESCVTCHVAHGILFWQSKFGDR